jgi:regulatory protein
VWQKRGVNDARKPRRQAIPLNQQTLEELALAYVGRFATTRAKLRTYLARKLRERGWEGAREADLAGLADRFAQSGLIDDAGYALAKAQTLTARGYGKRRVIERLRGAGVAESDSAAAREHSDKEALGAALRFAERRRLGPYAAAAPAGPKEREKAIATMIRAGHGFDVARAIVDLKPGAPVDLEDLAERARLTPM